MNNKFFLILAFFLFTFINTTLVLAAKDGMLAYGFGTNQTPTYRIWSGATQTWSTNYSTNSVGGTIEWVWLAAAPTRDEFILVTADDQDDINVQINASHGGTNCWGNGTSCNVVLEVNATSITTDTRKAHVAYENLSGDAMVVYSDGTPVPKMRIWNGTGWTDQIAVNDSSYS